MLRTYSSKEFGINDVASWSVHLESRINWPVKFEIPGTNSFEMEIEHFTVDSISFLNKKTSPVIINRSPHCKQSHYFSLNLLASGSLTVFHNNRKVLLNPGDFIIADSSKPSHLIFSDYSTTMSVILPSRLVKSYIPCLEAYCNILQPRSYGFNAVIQEIIINIWQQRSLLYKGLQGQASDLLMQLLALSLSLQPDLPVTISNSSRRVLEIKRFIEVNLEDTGLTPDVVARSFRLSPRYLRRIFAAEGDSIAKYIRRRRLQTSAKRMCDPLWKDRSITDICFSCGFESPAHFARVFKEYFGATPKDYRNKYQRFSDKLFQKPNANHGL